MTDHHFLIVSSLSVDAQLQFPFVSNLTLLLYGTLLSVGTLVGNVLILLITKTLRKPIAYLMCSLSATHFFWSLSHLSFYTAARVDELATKTF